MLKYNFLDSYLLCFVYKFFAVLYLRIRLFALLTAWKGNGTGVYAEISFPEFYNFFLFILFHFIFSLLFIYPRHLATLSCLCCVFIHEKENWKCFSRLLSRHFPPCVDHVL